MKKDQPIIAEPVEAKGWISVINKMNNIKNRKTQSLYTDIIQPIQGCFYYYFHNPAPKFRDGAIYIFPLRGNESQ